jgi:ABC-type spermidine/putrescine transport system permease subunit I
MQYDPIHIIGSSTTIDNYVSVNNPFYQSAMIYTFNVSVAVTAICLILGYPMSYILARMRSRRTANTLVVLLLAPLMVATVIRTYGWMILLGENGFLDFLVNTIVPTVHVNLLGTTIAVVVGLVNVSLPFSVLPLMTSIEKIDRSLEDAAGTLGCSPRRTFREIVLPLSVPGLISSVILVFTFNFSALVTPQLLGGRSDFTVSMLIYQIIQASSNWPLASALATVLLIISIFGSWLYLRTGAMRLRL